MVLSREIKKIRQKNLLSQNAFAQKINVSFSTVNRWERGKTIPNLNAMRNIREFCLVTDTEYFVLEQQWLDSEAEKNDEPSE